MTLEELRLAVGNFKHRSAWNRGVQVYASEMLDNLTEETFQECTSKSMLLKALLNGAPSARDYSLGGCSLIYDVSIAARLCNPSELRLCDYGRKPPNKYETWLDVQTRAIYQAISLILDLWEV